MLSLLFAAESSAQGVLIVVALVLVIIVALVWLVRR